MKDRIISIAVLLFAVSISVPAQQAHVTVHTREQMNRSASSLYSHTGDERWSRLEPVFAFDTLYPTSMCIPGDLPIEQSKAFAPCVRRMHDGKVIMFWQAGKQSSRIYYAYSFDGKHWCERRRLLGPEKVSLDGATVWRRYIGIDADILPSCEMLAVSAYWNDKSREKGCGIAMRRSRDGITWDKAVSIYEGSARNPRIVVIPEDGKVQCWFNDYCSNGSTSVMMIESLDKGITWSKTPIPVSRRFKYYNGGARTYTGYAPCVRVLPDRRQLGVLVEECDEPGGPGTPGECTIHGIGVNGLSPQPLSGDGGGPADKKKLLDGSSPCLSVFSSGETVISAVADGQMIMRLGDTSVWPGNGRGAGWLRPFRKLGAYASTSVIDSHHLVYTMDCADGIQCGLAYLNHVIYAESHNVVLDGDGSEWNADNALFIGSDSLLEAIFRFAQDESSIYILAEVAGCTNGADVECVLHNPSSKKMKSGFTVRAVVNAGGLVECGDYAKAGSIAGLEAACRQGRTIDGVPGFVAEIRIPKSALGASGEYAFRASVSAGDVEDGFTNVVKNKPETWLRVRMTDQNKLAN